MGCLEQFWVYFDPLTQNPFQINGIIYWPMQQWRVQGLLVGTIFSLTLFFWRKKRGIVTLFVCHCHLQDNLWSFWCIIFILGHKNPLLDQTNLDLHSLISLTFKVKCLNLLVFSSHDHQVVKVRYVDGAMSIVMRFQHLGC
jgi:hypothetical protein